ncbi:MAG: M20/M25/M40 family metallo-hydrolase [Deltaproteobacteria bacterium]|nr:M20/M25/M40 family metallo-hydrolase [Deltaproteobacteria bacterium]
MIHVSRPNCPAEISSPPPGFLQRHRTRRSWAYSLALAALCWTAVASPGFAADPPHQVEAASTSELPVALESTGTEDDRKSTFDPNHQVWITLEEDDLNLIRRSNLSLSSSLKVQARNRGIVAIPFAEGDLHKLSSWVHDTKHRCGGFQTHDTLEQARTALNAPLGIYIESAASYEIDNGARVTAIQGEMQAANILATIDDLSTDFVNRYYNTPSGRAAALSIRDRWQALASGRSDITVTTFDHSGWSQPSVILEIQGDGLASEVVVLGAHLDSKVSGSVGNTTPAPGADDDASGIAALTEVIRAAVANGYRPERTVKIMGYAAEEVGLRGSGEIAQDHLNRGINVVGVLQLDMVAFNGSADDIFLITDFTNSAQNDFIGNLVDTYQSELNWSTTACGYSCSDHASWQSRGFPASFPFEARFQQHNLQIHTANDTLATFGTQANHAVKFAKLAAAYMVELADDADGGGGGPDPIPCPAGLSTPAPGSTLGGATETFTWEACDGATQYWIYVGTSQGSNNILSENQGTSTSASVTGLPTDGSTVWFRLWTRTSSGWQNRDFSFIAVDDGGGGEEACPAELLSPGAGSTIGGTSTTLEWTPCSQASAFWIYLGTSSGGSQILSQSVGTNTSLAVTSLPSGDQIFVRVWSRIGGSWSHTNTSFFTP